MEDGKQPFEHERLRTKQSSLDFAVLRWTMMTYGCAAPLLTPFFLACFGEEDNILTGRVVGRKIGGAKKELGVVGEIMGH